MGGALDADLRGTVNLGKVFVNAHAVGLGEHRADGAGVLRVEKYKEQMAEMQQEDSATGSERRSARGREWNESRTEVI